MGNDPNDRHKKMIAEIQQKNIERIEALEKYCAEIEIERDLMKEAIALQIKKKHFDEECNHIKERINDIDEKNKSLKNAWIKSQNRALKLKDQHKNLRIDAYEQYPNDNFREYWTKYDKALSINEIDDKIIKLTAKINVFLRCNAQIMQKVKSYNKLERTVKRQQRKLEKEQDETNEKIDALKEIENKWKPKLEEAIDK